MVSPGGGGGAITTGWGFLHPEKLSATAVTKAAKEGRPARSLENPNMF
jgi:hypothetical protein